VSSALSSASHRPPCPNTCASCGLRHWSCALIAVANVTTSSHRGKLPKCMHGRAAFCESVKHSVLFLLRTLRQIRTLNEAAKVGIVAASSSALITTSRTIAIIHALLRLRIHPTCR
jgi:hypothetical protein